MKILVTLATLASVDHEKLFTSMTIMVEHETFVVSACVCVWVLCVYVANVPSMTTVASVASVITITMAIDASMASLTTIVIHVQCSSQLSARALLRCSLQ